MKRLLYFLMLIFACLSVYPQQQVNELYVSNKIVFTSKTSPPVATKGSVYVNTNGTLYIYDGATWNALAVFSVNSKTGNVVLTTTDIEEGVNQYFTDEKVDDRVSALIQNSSSISWAYDDVAGTFTGTVSLSPFSTSDLSEGSNLYYTEARVSSNTDVAANTTHTSSDGTDHTYINQDVRTTANPTFVTVNANLNGNAATSDKWSTTRTIELSGDVTSSIVNIDGSNNVIISNTDIKSFQNTINVDKSGRGDFTTITDALNSITDAAIDNTYVILVHTGIYAEQLVGKDYVSIISFDDDLVTITGSTPPLWQPSARKSSIMNLKFLCDATSSGYVIQSSAGVGVDEAENEIQGCEIVFTTSTPNVSGGIMDLNSDGLLVMYSNIMIYKNNNNGSVPNNSIIKYQGDLVSFFDTNILNISSDQSDGNMVIIDDYTTNKNTFSNNYVDVEIVNPLWNGILYFSKVNTPTTFTKYSISSIINLIGPGNGACYGVYSNTVGNSRTDINSTFIKIDNFATEYSAYAAGGSDKINGYFVVAEIDNPTLGGVFGDVDLISVRNNDFVVNTDIIDRNMFVGDATQKSLNDFFKTVSNAGWSFGGDITDNGDGTVDISAGYGFIRTSNDEQSPILMFDWAETLNITLTDNSPNYIKVIYNSGNPIVVSTTSNTVYENENDEFELYEIYREGLELHITKHCHRAKNIGGEIQDFLYNVRPIWYLGSGLQGGETGTRNITVTAGKLAVKLNIVSLSSINTSTGDDFDRYYLDGLGGFTKQTGQTQWDNNLYDDGSGTLSPMVVSKFSFQDFYIEADGDVVSLYGRDQYNSLGEAQNAPSLVPIPDRLGEHAIRAFRVVFQKGAATGTFISYLVKETPFSIQGGIVVTDHGGLAGLADDDHSQYVLVDGTRAMTGDLTVNSTGAIKMPNGTTAERPTGINGKIRYNTDENKDETYENGIWKNIITDATEKDLSNYPKKNSTEEITGNWTFSGDLKVDRVSAPTLRDEVASLGDVQDAVMGLSWQDIVISFFDPTPGLPSSPSYGDRYISTATANGWTYNYIYEWIIDEWIETIPLDGFAVFVDGSGTYENYNGSNWIEFSLTPTAHATSHENNGADEISVTGLSGVLAEFQKVSSDATLTGDGTNGNNLSVVTTGDWTGTFDGQEGSYYLNYANFTNTPNLSLYALLSGATFTGTVTAPTINATTAIKLGGVDINTPNTLSSVFYRKIENTSDYNDVAFPITGRNSSLSVSNAPTAGVHWYISQGNNDALSSLGAQLAVGYSDGVGNYRQARLYLRAKSDPTNWFSWIEAYTTANANTNTTAWNASQYAVAGTTVIDGSRNLTNIKSGNISENLNINPLSASFSPYVELDHDVSPNYVRLRLNRADGNFEVDLGGSTRMKVTATGTETTGNGDFSGKVTTSAEFEAKASDSEYIVRSLNSTAALDEQFYIRHNLSNTEIGVSRGSLKIITPLTVESTVTATGGNSTNWNSAYTHVSSTGTDHSYINQDLRTTASPSFVDVTSTSDKRKKNINSRVKGGYLRHVLNLKPVHYSWKDKTMAKTDNIGFIAQEVNQYFPQWIHKDKKGFLSLDYSKMGAVLAVQVTKELYEKGEKDKKELEKKIKKLDRKIEELQKQIYYLIKNK